MKEQKRTKYKSSMYGPLVQHMTGGVPVGKVSILGGHSFGHSKQESVYVRVPYSRRFPR
jgi:hypothetical protein